eukprot:2038483-Rhodomonas_salina.1
MGALWYRVGRYPVPKWAMSGAEVGAANPNATDRWGGTPLLDAVRNGYAPTLAATVCSHARPTASPVLTRLGCYQARGRSVATTGEGR